MNRVEFINVVAEKTGFTKKDTTIFVDTFIDAVKDTILDGESISFSGFGVFKPKTIKERVGRNPQTGEKVFISEKKSVGFKAGNVFRKELNG